MRVRIPTYPPKRITMTKRNSNPDPPSERPEPPPAPPLRGTSILAKVIRDLRMIDEMRLAERKGEIFKEELRAYCVREGITEKELMDRIRARRVRVDR